MSTRMHGSSWGECRNDAIASVCGDAMLSAEACQVVAVGSIATIICFLTVLAGRAKLPQRIRAGRSRRSRRSFGVRVRKRETSIDIERFPPAVP
jgi:hypothetical protein